MVAAGADVIAVDLGAESGRMVVGRFDGEKVRVEELHRFPNLPYERQGGLYWDVHRLFAEVLEGLRKARRSRLEPSSIGIDSWAVDFGLVAPGGELLESPRHYRDPRNKGMVEKALERVPAPQIYGTTGTQFLPINTLCQLLAMEDSPLLDAADNLLLIPDLICFWLTGRRIAEATNASTTQLFDIADGDWAFDLIERLGLPGHLLPPVLDPATDLGLVLPTIAESTGLREMRVITVASHDTASAVVGTPLEGERAAYLSSGTWSLLGFELDEPLLSEQARASNLSNELGFGNTVRLLRNMTGLWLLQESRRSWKGEKHESYAELEQAAARAAPGGPLIDPDLPDFLSPGDMPERIALACKQQGQRAPGGRAELLRCIFESLACKTRTILEHLEQASGRKADTIHIVGGGARNETLCRLTADIAGRPVKIGPAEATALGNVLVQLHAGGHVNGLPEMRELARNSFPPREIEPDPNRACWDELYSRFSDLTNPQLVEQPT